MSHFVNSWAIKLSVQSKGQWTEYGLNAVVLGIS